MPAQLYNQDLNIKQHENKHLGFVCFDISLMLSCQIPWTCLKLDYRGRDSNVLLLLLLTLVHGFNPSLWIVRWLSGTMIPYDYTALMKVLQGHLYWWPTWNDGAGYGWHISRTFSGKSKTRNDIQVAFIKFDIGITPRMNDLLDQKLPICQLLD